MKKTVHMIGNAHLDPVWLWNWQEGFQENKATFLSALDRLDELDEFIFTSSSAQFYKWIEENSPNLFERIKEKVKEGRWVICSGWWVQPDCNIPCGESFARNSLLAQNYFYEKFGKISTVGYCVDSFGHNGMLPQILKKSGMDNYVFMRPGDTEKELDTRAFIWESVDGSRVMAFRIPYSYCLSQDLDNYMDMLKNEFSDGVEHMMYFYGVGNHGGGPTIKNIEEVKKMQKDHEDINIIFSDPVKYFKAIENCNLPVIKGELQHHAAGCYSAQSMIKEINRKAENALLCAEKISVMAENLGKIPHSKNLNEAWELVLFNQFHDILAGTSLPSAYYDARNQLGESISVADRAQNNALQAISFDIDIPYKENTIPFVVFNPHSWDICAPIEFEIRPLGRDIVGEVLSVFDSDGKEIKVQGIASCCKLRGTKRYTFIANVKALGYSLYTLKRSEAQVVEFKSKTTKLENDNVKITFDMDSGMINNIYDKVNAKNIINESGKARVYNDNTDTWGHTIKKIDAVSGNFKCTSYKVVEDGEIQKSIRFTSEYGSSTLVQTYTLYSHDNSVHVDSKVHWREKSKAFKLEFITNLDKPIATVEMPYGYIKKEKNGWEEPMQTWANLSDKKCGLAIINNNKYSVDFTENRIAMTVLRSPVFAHHDPYVLREDEEYNYMEQGEHSFKYIIKPYSYGFCSAKITKEAMLLNQPFVSTFETFHKGNLTTANGYMSVNKDNIIMSTLKKSYDDNGFVLRLFESDGIKTTVKIKLFEHEFNITFTPHEIKSFKLTKEGEIHEVNLLEWEIK